MQGAVNLAGIGLVMATSDRYDKIERGITLIERSWIRFSEWLPRNQPMLSIYSTADTRRYDLGLVMSFRTRHLSRLCKQSLHLSRHQLQFARRLRFPPVRTRT
jgi:hypothetical protein